MLPQLHLLEACYIRSVSYTHLQEAGVDIDGVQKTYLRHTAFKMMLVTFLMISAAILASYIASKVGAKIGMTLRREVFEKVMSFSSAEMDRFQTSSLITRATNDIQQVQMTTTIMLRIDRKSVV